MVSDTTDAVFLILGISVILLSLVSIVREAYAHKPRRSVLAVWLGLTLLGLILARSDEIQKISTAGWTLELVKKAKDDAAEIEAIKTRVENQSATIDLVARKAGDAATVATAARKQIETADERLEVLNKEIDAAQIANEKLNNLARVARLLSDAENDSKDAYNELKNMIKTKSADESTDSNLKEILLSKYSGMQLKVPLSWKYGIDPQKLTFDVIELSYNDKNAHFDALTRASLVTFILNRNDLPSWKRLDFAIHVVKNDPSLRVVTSALHGFETLSDARFLPLDLDAIVDWWNRFEPVFWGP